MSKRNKLIKISSRDTFALFGDEFAEEHEKIERNERIWEIFPVSSTGYLSIGLKNKTNRLIIKSWGGSSGFSTNSDVSETWYKFITGVRKMFEEKKIKLELIAITAKEIRKVLEPYLTISTVEVAPGTYGRDIRIHAPFIVTKEHVKKFTEEHHD